MPMTLRLLLGLALGRAAALPANALTLGAEPLTLGGEQLVLGS